MPKFKLGDKFIIKGSKDSFPMVVVEIDWQEYNEPIYTLSNMYYHSYHYEIGEEALEEKYQKIGSSDIWSDRPFDMSL